jgi:hypothetical protein
MEQMLEMIFVTAGGKLGKIVLEAPRTNLSDGEVKEAMQTLLKLKIFANEGKDIFQTMKEARIITKTTKAITLS